MKELLVQFAAYHLWANEQLLHSILQLPETKQQETLPGSFPSLFKTVLHMWDAESIWWQRLKLQERVTRPSDQYTGNMQELNNQLLQHDRQWLDWITNAGDHQLQHVFQYQNTKRESFKQPVYQVLLHLFNHGTYHRGQLVTMLRELGVDKIPQTDFIVWSRKK
jgi:uncharacterized damage-inducible protein DinB